MSTMKQNVLHKALSEFKARLLAQVALNRLILFGSRARGDFVASSDVDVIVVIDDPLTEEIEEMVSDCAWQVGFEHDLLVVPVVFARSEWDDGPTRHSLLAKAVLSEGVSI